MRTLLAPLLLAGIVPDGEEIKGLYCLRAFSDDPSKSIEIRKFEPRDWAVVGDVVYFTGGWEFKIQGSDKWVE
jgi:hypothetical protein